ncbi:MAG: hypothetical protein ACRCWM_01105 [Sarcina sp.]
MVKKSNLKLVSSIFIKNHLRLISNKTTILNIILFTLPFMGLSYFMRVYNLGFRLIILLYITSFILGYFRKVLTSLFIFDDYESYLGFPILVKEVALSKFIVLNIEIGVQFAFFLLGAIFDGIIQGQAIWYYPVIIVGYFIANFLLLLSSFLISLIYYKIKTLLICSKMLKFRDIIENISKEEKTYKNKKYSKESKVKTLAMMDIKKVLRDKKLLLGFVVNTGGMLIFTVIAAILLANKFPSIAFFTMLVILTQVSVLCGLLPFIAFSKCEYDQEFTLMFPVEKKEYIKAKIISTIIFQIPIFILCSVIIFLTLDINIFYKLMSIIVIGINIIACVMLGINYDGKNMEFGVSLDDLSYKRIPAALGFIMGLSLLFGIFYLGPFCFTWITFEMGLICMGIVGNLLAVYFYKKVLTIEF